jgi:hypothetical protein
MGYNKLITAMRIYRLLTMLCLLALLSSACDALPWFRSTATPTRTLVPAWTQAPTRTPFIYPSRTPGPTKTITPTPTITPTRRPISTPITIVTEPQPVITSTAEVSATLGISYQQVRNGLEPFGFIFPEGEPSPGSLSYQATYPDIPLELEMFGPPESLTEMALSFTFTPGDAERTSLAASQMQRLLTLLFPAWDESSSWLLESFQEGLTSSDDQYDRTAQHGPLAVTFAMDRVSGEVTLTVSSSP